MRAAIVAGVITTIIYTSMTPALADTLTCSPWQGYRVCTSPGGYRSFENNWQGLTIGQDNKGAHWTTSRWRDGTITTIAPPGR
jgi:hypothetical protein